MSDQEFISYIGTVHSSISGSTGEYLATSISLNFESDRVALSTSNVSNYTGRVDIHDYGTSWTKIFSLSGPDGQNSSFGHEISLNWSGTRLAVSAYEVNKVYILDAIGTGSNIWSSYVSNTLNTSSLSLPGSAEFGYSISLAQDDGNRIAVGAPGQNKVYVYEYDSVNNNWGSGPVWTSTDSGINNVLAYAVDSSGLATSYIHAHAISNRYGHKVRLSAFGNYLIIGAPGETNASINSTTSYYPEGTTTNYTGSYTGQHQIGHVRCYTNDGNTWASGTTQYGQDIRGKAGTAIGTDNQPSFGTSCDISTNGNKITVSSPYKKVSTLPNAGQIDTYLINDDLDTWLSVSTSIAGAKSNQKLGMNHRLDFAGERLATGDLATSTQESAYYGGISLYAFDFGTDRWYDITRPIQLHNWPTVGSNDHNPVDITNGKIIAISDPRDPPGNSYNTAGTSGKVIFYQFPLTNAIQGNTSVGGYIKCENLYVGANDNSSNTDHSIANKRISFGGTIRDNSYEETYIENRSVDGAGKSELLLYKRNDIWDKLGGGPHSTNPANMVDDSIRLKAAEICLDYEDTNLHGTYPNAAVRNTRFLLNRSGQIALGNAYYNGEFDVVTDIDVNDKSFFWTTVNIGNKTNKPPNLTPALNTNNERMFAGLSTSSTQIGIDGKYGNQTFERYNVSSQAWDGDEFAFYFSNSDATIYEDTHPGNWHGSDGQFSCWIKLNDTQANCAGVLAWFGHDLHRAGTIYRGGWVKLTSSGLQFEYEANSANVQTVSYTFNQGSWYHVAVCFPTENTYPSATGNNWPRVKIDGVIQTISANPGSAYTGSLGIGGFDNTAYGFGSFLTFSRNDDGDVIFSGEIPVVSGSENNGIKNCWIALMDIGNGNINVNELYKILPGEMLTVGGICTITKYLGIGVSLPKYQLDVDGNINFTGNIYQNSNLFSIWTQSGSDIYYNSGNVGVGETSPTQLIHARGTGPQLFIEGATNENAIIRGSSGPSYRDRYHEISMGFFTLAGYGSSNYIDFKVNEGGQSNPGTRMRIRGDGHVGIGTSNPSGPLHIYESTGSSHGVNTGTLILDHGDSGGSSCIMFTSRINNSSDYGYIQYEDSTSSGDEKSRLIIGTQNDAAGGNEDNIILSPSSCVGIGTNFPTAAKVHVNGSRSLTLSYAYYNNTGSPGIGSGTNDYSIYASDRIAATEFNAFSDSRIKKNVTDINDSSALDKIRLLEPKIYNYIDEKQRGTSNVYGFIAQEVANVLPYAVTVGHGDIPNILTNSNVIVTENSNVIELHLDTPVEGLTLSNTSVINIITDKDTSIPCNVLSFSGSNVITIENRKEFSNVTGAYIHGEHILDFHNLNKDAIWSVATAALQEVDRQLQAEKTKVADLIARVTALENN
jgi:hypothetical protein